MLGFGARGDRPRSRSEEPESPTPRTWSRARRRADAALLRRAEKLGLIRPLGDGRYEVPSPTLLRAGEELAGMGVPPCTCSRSPSRSSATRARSPTVRAPLHRGRRRRRAEPGKRSPQEWALLSDALTRLRPLAGEAVRAVFEQTMSAAVERQLQKTLKG